MYYVEEADQYLMRFEDDEIFPDRLLEFLAARSLRAGAFSGIGAMRALTIAFFDTGSKRYLERDFDEQMEVLALTGNVAVHEGAPLVHAHVTLGRNDYSVIGGHLRRGVVRPTLEVALRVYPWSIERKIDPVYGLPGLELPDHF